NDPTAACSVGGVCGNAIALSARTSGLSTLPASTLCADIGNGGANTIGGSWNVFKINLAALSLSTFKVGGWNGSPANDPRAFVAGNNGVLTADVRATLGSSNQGSFTGDGSVCSPLFFATGGVPSLDWRSSQPNFYLDQFSFDHIRSRSSDLPIASDESVVTATNIVSASLNQKQLDSIVAAAILRWSATGLTQQQIATLQSVKFEASDLSGSYLGEAAGGNRILVDRDAGGNGWFVDGNPRSDSSFIHATSATRLYADPRNAPAGHIDLLTAIMHEMGHKLGLDDSYAEKDRDNLMYGYLTVGERRIPSKGQAASATPNQSVAAHFLSLVPSV